MTDTTDINNIIDRRIQNDLNDFNGKYNKEMLNKMENIMMTNNKFTVSMIKIVIKDGIITAHNTEGDNRKNLIVRLLVETVKYMSSKNKKMPNTTLYIYVSDVYAFEYQDIPFFVLAKPRNRTGILFPDNTFLCHPLISECDKWDFIKKTVKQKCEKTIKINEIYFKGANTGSTKHNLRYLLSIESKKSNKKIPLNVIIGEKRLPMYAFCKYKYLLNLPGHQPWSYRFKYLFLMKSLVIDVAVRQHYSEESYNEKWINFFDDVFIKGIDFVELTYDWYENKDNTNEYNLLLKNIEETYEYYEKNNDAYNEMVENGTNKANIITNDLVYETVYKLVSKYADRFN
jgi:hypothetical protein